MVILLSPYYCGWLRNALEVKTSPGALGPVSKDPGACSVADEVPPAAKAPGPLGTEESFRYRF
jgi:hypothetical protein